MIEIVLTDSACGGLKMAQQYGEGNYAGGCTSVIFSKKDGSEPTPAEIEEAQKAAEEQIRLKWEKGTPMGGNPADVFGFNLMLSIGDISKDHFAIKRQQAINELWSIYPDDPSEGSFDVTTELSATLQIICERGAHGEDIRIWYSNQPDELCGLYWFMAELQPLEKQLGTVLIVKLPEYEYHENNAVVNHVSWGEISPGNWHQYTALAEATTSVFRLSCAMQWRSLQEENAPLRAVLNGKLHGVPENIYDSFIFQEIAKQDNEFHEANLIGNVLGNYQLGIGDAWVAHRIESMIADGKLLPVSDAPKDGPIYHRRLKKNHIL